MILRMLLLLVLWLPLLALAGIATQVATLADDVPEVPDLYGDFVNFGSRVETLDGWYLAGSRVTSHVALAELPPHVVGAFIAAEDQSFFQHSAFDLRGILRAFYVNYRAGETVEGASTISQQVARRGLGRERSYRRKVREILTARRIEANYSKLEILEVYLGGVFLGARAEGVTQAAWRYFGKDPRELEVGEAAMLAGILPAPSVYNPHASLEAAQRERDRVLRRMFDMRMIDEAELESELSAPLNVRDAAEDSRVEASRMPGVAASARRFLEDRYGEDAWAEGGLTVVVPHHPVAQALARSSLREGVMALDRRQGYRTEFEVVAGEEETFDESAREMSEGSLKICRVGLVGRDRFEAICGQDTITVELEGHMWMTPPSRQRHFKRPAAFRTFADVLEPGHVIVIRIEDDDHRVESWPSYEGAILVTDSQTGEVRASVGGFDTEASVFDRVFQGCRQPGSVFKPIVYAEALSMRVSAATMLSDSPAKLDTGRGGVWEPRNADRDFRGYITLADSLAASRNIPTVHLMNHVRASQVVSRSKKLGVTSTLDPTSSMSLGASCLRPYEVSRVYSAFQRGGQVPDILQHAYVVTPDGLVEMDALERSSSHTSLAARLDRAATVMPADPSGVTPQVAHIMLELLRRVVTRGTAHELPDEWAVAGKTGTSNEFDAWFVGFDGRRTTTVWIGSDRNERPLGSGEHGATVAMPVFAQAYAPYARLTEEDPWPGEPPERIEHVRIDPKTGLLARPGEPGVEYPFLEGTAPRDFAPTRGTRQAQDIDALIYDF